MPILPRVSVIVPSKDSQATLLACLDSLTGLNYPRELLQIIVVDSSAAPAHLPPHLESQVLLIHRSCSAPAAYNYALPLATGEVIAFIDSDAIAEPSWLQELVSCLGRPEVAGAGGIIQTWNRENPLARAIGYELERRYIRMPRRILRISTSNLVIRKNVLYAVGGLDEDLPTGYDAKLGADISKRGHEILFEPKAVVYHFHRPTLAAYFRQQRTYATNDVKLYFTGFPSKLDNVTSKAMLLELGFFGILILMLAANGLLFLAGAREASLVGITALLIGGASYAIATVVRGIVVARKMADPSAAIWYPLILLVRVAAWALGGAVGLLSFRREVNRGRSCF